MYICKKCGVVVPEGVKFCQNCGEPAIIATQQEKYIPDKGFKEMFFKTSGRLNRKRFIKRILAVVIGGNILTALLMGTFTAAFDFDGLVLSTIPITVVSICMIVFGLSLNIRRWHDMDKSGWYVLANILIIPIFFLLFKKGTDGPNKYGADPLETEV